MDAIGVECHARSRDYAWSPVASGGLPLITVPTNNPESPSLGSATFSARLAEALTSLKPDVVAIPGWSAPEALAALRWCVRNKVTAVLMSESCAHDEPRVGWKEWVKHRIVGLFGAGLVGGSAHQTYLGSLGMKPEQIFLGYDVVDNTYFKHGADQIRASSVTATAPDRGNNAFLASARFIEKKNLHRLLDAYAAYREQTSPATIPWSLTLLGDGPLRESLESQVSNLGLQEWVSMPGFLQYEDLPRHYANASAFIHASTTEQWGLVVNEAMASGLPVLVSNRCGCAPDLVREGVNGYTFDPEDTKSITSAMLRMSALSGDQRLTFALAGQTLINDWGPERFGDGMHQAATCARDTPPRRPSLVDSALLTLLSRR